ncbi:MAG: capsule biosynthesis protein CapA [Rhodospirillales bacterium]|nr:capsule biosynthesis protein CapA [Rhodospirillales bacterium]
MQRRAFLAGTAALAVTPSLHAKARSFRVHALGQALLQHELGDYPGFAELARRLRGADVVFSELETVIEGAGTEAPTRDLETLHAAPPGVLRTLRALSVNLLAVSSNHAFDLGSGGIVSTLDALEAAGFAHAGTGRNLAAASAPAFLTAPAGRVALVSMATGKIRPGGAATAERAGVNELRQQGGRLDAQDEARILGEIDRAARNADLVIAYHHNHDWHEPDPSLPPPWLEAWARRCVDRGAHLFVGHGFPSLQGIELRNGRAILYDLASLMFQTRTKSGRYPDAAWESAIADLQFESGKLRALELVPLLLNERGEAPNPEVTRGRPVIAHGAEAARILGRVEAASSTYGTRFERRGDTLRVLL